jgi:hypothetical protein
MRQEGASWEVRRQATPLTVIRTMPTPEKLKKREMEIE